MDNSDWWGKAQAMSQANAGSAVSSSAPYTTMAKVAIGVVTVSVATYVVLSRYNGRDLIRRLRRSNQPLTLSQRCA